MINGLFAFTCKMRRKTQKSIASGIWNLQGCTCQLAITGPKVVIIPCFEEIFSSFATSNQALILIHCRLRNGRGKWYIYIYEWEGS